jgi:hypothetical protein
VRGREQTSLWSVVAPDPGPLRLALSASPRTISSLCPARGRNISLMGFFTQRLPRTTLDERKSADRHLHRQCVARVRVCVCVCVCVCALCCVCVCVCMWTQSGKRTPTHSQHHDCQEQNSNPNRCSTVLTRLEMNRRAAQATRQCWHRATCCRCLPESPQQRPPSLRCQH